MPIKRLDLIEDNFRAGIIFQDVDAAATLKPSRVAPMSLRSSADTFVALGHLSLALVLLLSWMTTRRYQRPQSTAQKTSIVVMFAVNATAIMTTAISATGRA